MPVPYLQKLSKEKNIPIEDLERYWKDAKDQVGDNYALVTAIVKKRAGVKESFFDSNLSADEYIKLYKYESI